MSVGAAPAASREEQAVRALAMKPVGALLNDELLMLVRLLHTPDPVPPCRVCGGPLHNTVVSRTSAQWHCTGSTGAGEYLPGRSSNDQHYEASLFVQQQLGDLWVLELAQRFETLVAQQPAPLSLRERQELESWRNRGRALMLHDPELAEDLAKLQADLSDPEKARAYLIKHNLMPKDDMDVGCEDKDGMLIIHPESETCVVCAKLMQPPQASAGLQVPPAPHAAAAAPGASLQVDVVPIVDGSQARAMQPSEQTTIQVGGMLVPGRR